MTPLEDIRSRIELMANIIKAPAYMLPVYGRPDGSGASCVQVDDDMKYHYVTIERGIEFQHLVTADAEELLYWVFRDVTRSLASEHEFTHRQPGEDPHAKRLAQQLVLLGMLNQEWRDICKNEV